MMPIENRMKARLPATGRNASAACAAVSTLVIAVGVQRRRGRHDDEERDGVGEHHPDPGVGVDVAEMAAPVALSRLSSRAASRRAARRICGLASRCRWLSRDSSASCEACQKNRYGLIVVPNTATTVRIMIAVERDAGDQRRTRDLAPRDGHAERGRDVEQQHQCEEFQQAGVAVIGQPHFQHETDRAEHQRVEDLRTADDEAQRLAHRGEIGRDIDRVGNDEKPDQHEQHRRGQFVRDVAREPLPRLPADPCADDLDRRHERQRQEHGPGQREAELRAGLAVGRDPARIVVGRAGDEPRAERPPEPLQADLRHLLLPA